MRSSHSEQIVLHFDIRALSDAVSKVCLRQREKDLMKQKASPILEFMTAPEPMQFFSYTEELLWRLIDLYEMDEQEEEELQFIRQIKRYKNEEVLLRIKEMLLAQLRGKRRSAAMRFATDLSLETMPTPPTAETALASLSCGRKDYESI